MQSPAKVTLWKDITAIGSSPAPNGGHHGGFPVPLPEGAELTVCGEGFSERTVTVECQGCRYLCFGKISNGPTPTTSPETVISVVFRLLPRKTFPLVVFVQSK